jgi:hypothetical protein
MTNLMTNNIINDYYLGRYFDYEVTQTGTNLPSNKSNEKK